MPGATARDAWPRARAKVRRRGRAITWALPLLMALSVVGVVADPSIASADPVRGEASLSKPGDYARLVVKLKSEVAADVRLAGTILIIHFKAPVDVPVDKLAEALPDYI